MKHQCPFLAAVRRPLNGAANSPTTPIMAIRMMVLWSDRRTPRLQTPECMTKSIGLPKSCHALTCVPLVAGNKQPPESALHVQLLPNQVPCTACSILSIASIPPKKTKRSKLLPASAMPGGAATAWQSNPSKLTTISPPSSLLVLEPCRTMKCMPDSGMRPSFTYSVMSALRRHSPSVPARVGSRQARFPSLTGTRPRLRPWQAPTRWLPREHQILYDAAVLKGVASRAPNVPTLPKACLPNYDARHAPSKSLRTQRV